MKRLKREIEKFPYGTVQGLSEAEARDNIKLLLQLIKTYGPTALRIALVVYLIPTSASADGTPAPSNSSDSVAPSGNSLNVLPATKEFLGIAAVGLVCAAAAANPITALGIAACVVTVVAKACNKL